jgi:methionyl-tRNA formyltransferase
MEILLLSPHIHLIEFFENDGDKVIQTEAKIDIFDLSKVDWIVSYDYRHIITKEQIKAVNGQAINCHISYLPWNRGADPNLWSFIDNTPKGVTIHYIDDGLDTGDIIFQKQVKFAGEGHTLSTTYNQLHLLMDSALKATWDIIKIGNVKGKKQEGKGSYHRSSDKEKILLPDGWNTKVIDLRKPPIPPPNRIFKY